MIEGLKLDFTSTELVSHLEERVRHHEEREVFYRDKAGALKDGGAEASDFTGGDPIRALVDKETQHHKRAAMFRILAAHVVPDEVYRLEERDLERLEFLSRYF